ncbi:MAG: hydroxymethylbilane synthase [Candidatus Sericytochromatia bacterium]|nr:hydroxymethylbilane synthase [Candidatus Sericytochromatia bacterium]
MTEARIRLGTRGSALALWQTAHVGALLRAADPALRIETVVIKTAGDKILDVPLARIGDRGLFVKEIEEALLDGRIDAAVHSLKDLPTSQPVGLLVGAVLARADARDCLVSTAHASLAALPAGAVVGTSSLRRRAQLQAHHPRLRFEDVRGNLQTRLAKLDAGQYDALVLAVAGLERLGLHERIRERLAPEVSLPAVGQGALAVECRADDRATLARLLPLTDGPTLAAVTAERALLAAMEGGCQVPIGAHATLAGERLTLTAMVGSLDGSTLLQVRVEGATSEAASLGLEAARALHDQGAAAVLDEVRRAEGA